MLQALLSAKRHTEFLRSFCLYLLNKTNILPFNAEKTISFVSNNTEMVIEQSPNRVVW